MKVYVCACVAYLFEVHGIDGHLKCSVMEMFGFSGVFGEYLFVY